MNSIIKINTMKKIALFLFLNLMLTQLIGQEIKQHTLREIDPNGLYLNDGNSETLFYYELTPEKYDGSILILLPGFFRNAKEIFIRTTLPEVAKQNNIATLVPSLNSRIHSDSNCFDLINEMILHYSKQNAIQPKNIIIGGLSAGGIISLTYTISMIKHSHDKIPAPKACFTIDSPVDLYNFWFVEKRLAERNCSQAAVEEANYVLQYFSNYLGGTPKTVPETYKAASAFSRLEKNGGNAFYLKNVSIRAYCEPDIAYHLEKCEDFFDMNAADLSAMINCLKIQGNEQAELITTINKGVRPDGTKHPHSWSILDSKECITWIKRVVKKN